MHRWMTAQGHKLEAMPIFLINNFQQIILTIERIRTDLRREMLAIIRQEQLFERQLAIIKTVPGIADILGIIILAEFGDFYRFTNADAVACWTGLTERSHVSNRQKYPGKISKAGSGALRWALCEAGFQLACSDVKYNEMYKRIEIKTGKAAIARTALARRLARYIWKMVVSETPFRKGESRKRQKRANDVRLRRQRRKKQLKERSAELAMSL